MGQNKHLILIMPKKPNISSEKLKENIIFTHTTCVLPPGGIMTPGSYAPESRIKTQPARFSLHWYMQGLTPPHALWSDKNKPYFIAEPARHLRDSFYGGNVEDCFSLGPYRLSEESVIYVPEVDFLNAQSILYPGYAGRLVSYNSRDEVAVLLAEFIAKHCAPTFKLEIPPNQTIDIETPVVAALALINDPSMSKQNKAAILAAQKKKTSTVTLTIDAHPRDVNVIFNGEHIKSQQFLSSWIKEGFVFCLHSESDFDALSETFLNISCLALDDGSTRAVMEFESAVKLLRTLIAEVYQTLKDKNFPKQVIESYEQIFCLDIESFLLPAFQELAAERIATEVKMQKLMEAYSQLTTYTALRTPENPPAYEAEPLERHVLLYDLAEKSRSQLQVWNAYKHGGKDACLVDAVAEVPSKGEQESIRRSLQQFGIFSYVREARQIIVPDINTPGVARAIQNC